MSIQSTENEITLLSTAEVQERLGVTRQRVSQIVASGRLIPALRTPGGHMLFTPAEVERYKRLPRAKGGRPSSL